MSWIANMAHRVQPSGQAQRTNSNTTNPTPLTQITKPSQKRKHKKPIPKAIREQIWIRDVGKVFEAKCKTTWCQNLMTAWDFHAGHDIPESKGGKTEPGNLVPICSRCNLSMGDSYTFKEWNALSGEHVTAVPVASSPSKWWCACG